MPRMTVSDRNRLPNASQNVRAGPFHLLILAGLLLAIGCSDQQPTEPESGALAPSPLSLTTTTSDTYFLFGHNNGLHQIERVDPTNGSRVKIGETGWQTGSTGIATARGDVPGPNGSLYPAGTYFGVIADQSQGLFPHPSYVVALDTETGEANKLVSVNATIRGRGAAFGPDGVTLYVIDVEGRLMTVSTVDGSVQQVGTPGLDAGSLEWDPDREKFLTVATGNLYEVDPVTAEATLLGAIGINTGALTRSPEGAWFATYGFRGSGDGALYSIDIGTPSATKIGGSGMTRFGGMAFAPARSMSEPPTNVSAAGPYTGEEGSPITFTATGSDPEGTTVTFTWALGDGSTVTGKAVDYAYTDDGAYDVTLTATDGDGISRLVTTTATISNAAPSVTAGADAEIYDGESYSLNATFSDPGAADAPWSYTIDWGDGSAAATGTTSDMTASITGEHTYPTEGNYTLKVTVTDKDGASGSDRLTVTVVNPPPTAEPGGPYNGTEGSAASLSLTGSDPDGDALTYMWDLGDGTTGSGTSTPASHTYADDGSYTITLTVTDADGASDTQSTTATIDNVAPTITSVSGPADPQPMGTQISFETGFTDPGPADTHDATVYWGDGTSSTLTGVTSPFQAAYTYAAPGVYTVTVMVSDGDGGSDSESYEYVVIYDPDAGFVTGGGWIDSPAGAYTADAGLEGKATFGFVSKYRKGAEVPSGNTEFVFKAAYFGFHSDAYEWLVVNQNGTNAQFRGNGLVNGETAPNGTEYQFMLWAGDDTSDTFRIRIWWEDSAGAEHVVYDNGYDQLLGGGSIVIHAK